MNRRMLRKKLLKRVEEDKMAYTHYLENSPRNNPSVLAEKNKMFSVDEWNDFVHQASKLLHAWYSECAKADITDEIDTEHTTKGIFSGNTTDTVNSAEEIEKAIHNNKDGEFENFFLINTSQQYNFIYFEDKLEDKFSCGSILFCKTNHKNIYDDLVVALYALACHVTNNRLKFSSDGELEDLQAGLNFLKKITGIAFDFENQYSLDERFAKAIKEAPLSDVIEFCNDYAEDYKIYTNEDLNELYRDKPMELVELFERCEAVTADYYGYVSPTNGETLDSLTEAEVPDAVLNALIDVDDDLKQKFIDSRKQQEQQKTYRGR